MGVGWRNSSQLYITDPEFYSDKDRKLVPKWSRRWQKTNYFQAWGRNRMPSHTLILTLLMLSLHSLKKYRRTGIQFSCSEAKFLKFDVLSGSSWACATERESWRGTQDRPTHKRSFKSQWVYVTVSAVQTFWCPKVWPGCRGNPRPAGAHVMAPTSQRWPSQCGRSETAAPATRLERRGEERRGGV